MFRPRALLLGLLWVSIVLAAHPLGPARALGERAWDLLAPLGLDVAITPLTVDMQMMGEGEGRSAYQRKPEFSFRDARGRWTPLAWADASFYGLRVPFLLMMGIVENGVSAEGYVHGICYEIGRAHPDVIAFRMRLLPSRPDDFRRGLSTEWVCPPLESK